MCGQGGWAEQAQEGGGGGPGGGAPAPRGGPPPRHKNPALETPGGRPLRGRRRFIQRFNQTASAIAAGAAAQSIRLGRKSATSGSSTINTRNNNNMTKKGITPLISSPVCRLNICFATKRLRPMGGVIRPISMLTV